MQKINFDHLSLVKKLSVIEGFAVELCSIEFYDHRIDLYALGGHFIEVYQNIETKQIEKIMEASYSEIDKYLTRITFTLPQFQNH